MLKLKSVRSSLQLQPKSSRRTCWICLGGGRCLGGSGRRLVSGCCSCRGSSGHVHLPCLVEYARTKSGAILDGTSAGHPFDPWLRCPNCRQWYTNDLGVWLTAELVAFVKERRRGDRALRVEAHHQMLQALMNHARCDVSEVRRAAEGILSMIDRMSKSADPRPAGDVQWVKASACYALGFACFREGTREGLFSSAGHLERSKATFKAAGYEAGVMHADVLLRAARSRLEGGRGARTTAKELEGREDICRLCIAKGGEASPSSVCAGVDLAASLRRARRHGEADELLGKLEGVSLRVHGADHDLTAMVRSHRSRHEGLKRN